MRIQVEEMHVYYFIAKKLISNAKLGFMGIMSGAEERLLNNIYNSWNMDEIDDLSKKLLDKLDKVQTEMKINTNPHGLKDTEELISIAVSYTSNLLFKPEVLENVKKTLKADLNTHDKIILCIDKICQTKRILMGLSPDERKKVLDGKGIEVSSEDKKERIIATVQAVDEENVSNMTEVEASISSSNIDVSKIPLDEDVVEAIDDDVDEGNKPRNVFTADDMPIEPIEHYVNGVDLVQKEKEEEIEILDFEDEDELVDVSTDTDIEDSSIDKVKAVEEIVENKDIEIGENLTGDEIVVAPSEVATQEIINENTLDNSFDEVIEDDIYNAVNEKETIKEETLLRDNIIIVSDRKPILNIKETSEDNILETMEEKAIESNSSANELQDLPVEKKYYEVPEIIKIIEKNGMIVDEDIMIQ